MNLEIYHRTRGIISVLAAVHPDAEPKLMTAKRRLPLRIWADWQRCYPVLRSMRLWMILQFIASRGHAVTISEIAAQPGIRFESNKSGKQSLNKWAEDGWLRRTPNNRTANSSNKIRESFLYELSPLSCRLLGIDPTTHPAV